MEPSYALAAKASIALLCSIVLVGHFLNSGKGVVYTRWGRTSCPNDTGAELVYEGITGGSFWDHGGGANYVCLPKDPQYMSTHVPPSFFLFLHAWYWIWTS